MWSLDRCDPSLIPDDERPMAFHGIIQGPLFHQNSIQPDGSGSFTEICLDEMVFHPMSTARLLRLILQTPYFTSLI